MIAQRGLTRFVLLRSGGYSYAELELDQPIHLIADNNLGKTTLIAALQFLYIEDQGSMSFSHNSQETRRHYFPTTESLMLFECLTPTGFQVFGLRGLGLTRGYDFQRFIFRGTYQRSDFFDGKTGRLWAEVAKTLLAKNLEYMEPKHLKQSLIGNGDVKGPPLALVPLKNTGSYNSFCFLFRNLLELSKIDQDKLKELFIDITRPRLQTTSIDPRRDNSELYAEVQRQKAQVEGLQKVAPKLDELLQYYNHRQELQGILAKTWRVIERKVAAEQLSIDALRVTFTNEQTVLSDQIEELRKRVLAIGMYINEITAQHTLKKQDLKRLDELRSTYGHFEEQLEAAMRTNLEAKRDGLIARLSQAAPADRRHVETRLAELAQQIHENEQVEARFSDALVTWLRQQHVFSDEEIDDLFRILDPGLLAGIVGPSGITISDTSKFLERLRGILDCMDNEGFATGEVFIHRPAMRSSSVVSKYLDISMVRERIAAMKKEHANYQRTLDDIGAQDRLKKEINELNEQHLAAQLRLKDWQEWRRKEPGRAALVGQLEKLETDRSTEVTEQERLAQEQLDLRQRKLQLEKDEGKLTNKLEDLLAAVRKLNPPSSEWQIDETPQIEAPLEENIVFYASRWNEHREVSGKFELLFTAIETDTNARYAAETEAATISSLQDEAKALADHERAAQDLWKNLVDGMKRSFRALTDALDELRKEVTKLNRALSERKISNLERVELELQPQKDLVQRLKAVLDEDDLPLFVDPATQSKARQKVIDWLEEGKRIEILELFDIHFKITDRSGRTETHKSLAKIHSEGTSTTIKVLVHLELLKNLLNDESVVIPFCLDEVAKLDEKNLRGLIAHASAMSFIPLLASPVGSDCVRALYFLRLPEDGGIVLDETSRMIIEVSQ